MKLCSICLFVTGLLHLVKCQYSSMLQPVLEFPSLLGWMRFHFPFHIHQLWIVFHIEVRLLFIQKYLSSTYYVCVYTSGCVVHVSQTDIMTGWLILSLSYSSVDESGFSLLSYLLIHQSTFWVRIARWHHNASILVWALRPLSSILHTCSTSPDPSSHQPKPLPPSLFIPL